MKASFTPGPWKNIYGKIHSETYITTGAAIARVNQRKVAGQQEANARLIAAAPEILSALRELQANPNDPRSHRTALVAMIKATGEA